MTAVNITKLCLLFLVSISLVFFISALDCSPFANLSSCSTAPNCTWSFGSCVANCFQYWNTDSSTCQSGLDRISCEWDSMNFECTPFGFMPDCFLLDGPNCLLESTSCNWNGTECKPIFNPSNGPQCWLYDSNQTECNLAANCTWNTNGFCDLDCMQKQDTTLEECESQFDGMICKWDSGSGDCKPMGFDECFTCHNDCMINNDTFECHQSCDNETFCLGEGGTSFSTCYYNDGDKDSCIAEPDCVWMPDVYGPLTAGFENGWCNPTFMNFNNGDSCMQYNGNKISCESSINLGIPCKWENDPWGPLFEGNESGWCNYMMGGGSGCWEYDSSEESCNSASLMGMPCSWKNDSYSFNGGWCEQQGCWFYDQTNETACVNESAAKGLNCAWDSFGDYCFQDFGDGCSEFDQNQIGCYGTGYCIWDPAGNGTCDDPMTPMFNSFMNPGCWIFDMPGESVCNNVSTCNWNTGICEDSGANMNNGVQCEDIMDSNMCNKIPMLSTCCSWNGTSCEQAPFTTQCWDNMQSPPEGAMFCEDYNAINNETLCRLIADDPWYMPCVWNQTGNEKCGFAFMNMFGGAGGMGFGFQDIGSQSNCESAGGIWKSEKWTNIDGKVYTDEWCEMNFGFGKETCDDMCWACEFQANNSDWPSSTDAQNACESSSAFGGNCVFHQDSNAFNGYGWCEMNASTFQFNYIDFEIENCLGFIDQDNDGYTPSQDPDCAEFFKFGYIEIEKGTECDDGIDNDGNGLADCNDFGCMFDSYYCENQPINDTTPPKITWKEVNEFINGALFSTDTDKPSNATIQFYNTNASCTLLNSTILDPKLLNDFTLDNFDFWHDISILNLASNTTYYYKIELCSQQGNCSIGKCSNFTTSVEVTNYTVSFDLPIIQENVTEPLGMIEIGFDTPVFDGDYDDALINSEKGVRMNEDIGKEVNIRFRNPNATAQWEIYFMGAKLIKASSLNVSDAFKINNSNSEFLLGLTKSKWEELAQKLGVEMVRIVIPVGVSDASRGRIKHCPDDVTDPDDARCLNLNLEDLDCNFTDPTKTICDVPVNIGFSVFAVYMAETTGGGNTGGGGGSTKSPAPETNVTSVAVENTAAPKTQTTTPENSQEQITGAATNALENSVNDKNTNNMPMIYMGIGILVLAIGAYLFFEFKGKK